MTTPHFMIELLDVENYSTWEFKLKNVLISKDLWDAIEGTGKIDPGVDAKALAQINLAVKEHHFATLRACKTAKEAWEALASIYKSKSEARKLALHQELLNLAMLGGEDITQYVNRAKRIRGDLLAAGEDDKAINVIVPVLNGLPDSYTPLRLALFAVTEKLTLDNLQTRLINAEQLLSRTERTSEPVAFTVRPSFKGDNARPNKAKKDVICHFCKKRGHIMRECKALKALKEQKDAESSASRSAAAIAF